MDGRVMSSITSSLWPAAARARRATCSGRRPRRRRPWTRSNVCNAPDGEGGTEEAPPARGRGGRRLRPWLHPGDCDDVKDGLVDPPERVHAYPPDRDDPVLLSPTLFTDRPPCETDSLAQ